ncbi:HXXEE domain-containing protein [Paenibacillus sp.]|uniref:HXXEE domain-containing protein n=1 Tax=Paenibacillus sp. TaxID=58172 RepID=UPI002D558EF1|nr:HXXEE domain-containing protein [Paenibacillus sp.]HZG87601.1 HXXEE domain-containing protein [Paenibacillus sp.]
MLYAKLPRAIASRVVRQFSMSTAQFFVAVLIVFLFVSSSTYMANQYVNQGPLGSIHFFTVVTLVFFLHAFTHIGQSVLLRSITPGVITSVVVVIPYSLGLYYALLEHRIMTWGTIWVSLPFMILIFPVLFFAHWIGKKTV